MKIQLTAMLAAGLLMAAAPVPPADPAPSPIDPEVVPILEKMGDYYKTLKAYSIHVDSTTDEVLVAGPKVQYGGTIDLTVRRPDRLHAVIARDDAATQEFFYDGKTLTVFIPERNVYASAPMPGTVPEMVAATRAKYDLAIPLDGLLKGVGGYDLLKDAKAAIVIGAGRVEGVDCDHVGAHYEDVDGQLWVEQGERPLPRKFILTTLSEPTQPQHAEILTWDLSPKIDEAKFTFVPPAGAQKIVFVESAKKSGK